MITTAIAQLPAGRTVAELIENISASRLSLFHQCRLKFFFRYVAGIKKPKTGALHLGSSIHLVLKHWNKCRWKNQVPTLKSLNDVFQFSWDAEQQQAPVQWEPGEEEEQKKVGWRLLETYFRESPIPPDEKPEAVEVVVEADLSEQGLTSLVGIIDLVRQGGIITDFKTSSKTPNAEQVAHTTEIQTTAYALLYRESAGKAEAGIELHHLVKNKSPKLIVSPVGPATDAQIERLYRVIESYIHGLEQEDWVPSPGFQCMSCEFFNECRKWH